VAAARHEALRASGDQNRQILVIVTVPEYFPAML
jgi:hypothetical protein